ncbi:hypothetical protein ALC62_06040 [Cyphomyrmex costatus]|uniref:Uncharacterized protein n=1 Tax=Cyphomyrmex costatus TaxID=456900 RepID=A0A195CR08_9HYME|nr:hypothetical protein ALC62_06040 [Cyphomyrmex costatus]
MTQAQRLLTVISSRDAGFDRNNKVECLNVLYIPDRAERNYPGLDLEMLNSLTTHGARHSACQLPAHLRLTAWSPETVSRGLSRSQNISLNILHTHDRTCSVCTTAYCVRLPLFCGRDAHAYSYTHRVYLPSGNILGILASATAIGVADLENCANRTTVFPGDALKAYVVLSAILRMGVSAEAAGCATHFSRSRTHRVARGGPRPGPAAAARDWALPASRSPGSRCKSQCESVYKCVCVKLYSLSFFKGPVPPPKATSKYSSARRPQTRPSLAPSQFRFCKICGIRLLYNYLFKICNSYIKYRFTC